MQLQETFYLLGIIYMSLMLLIMIGLVIAIFIIKSKINAIHRNIEDKLQTVTNIAHLAQNLKTEVAIKAKRAKEVIKPSK
jgi:hypothetical protein